MIYLFVYFATCNLVYLVTSNKVLPVSILPCIIRVDQINDGVVLDFRLVLFDAG